jgi:hypothetical protein
MNENNLDKLAEVKEKAIELMEEIAGAINQGHYNKAEVFIALTMLYREMQELIIDEYGEEYIQAVDEFIRENFEDVGVNIRKKGDRR